MDFDFFLNVFDYSKLMTVDAVVQMLIVLTGVMGHWFVARKSTRGFYIWIFSNFLVLYSAFDANLFGLAITSVINTGFCIYALREWPKRDVAL